MEEQDNKKSLVDTFLRVIAKHSISLHMMSRDMNIARINIQKLVKLEGGKVRDKPDAMWKSEERLDAELEKEKEKLKPQKVEKTEVKEKSLFEKISGKIGDKISSPIKKAKDVIFNIFKGLFNPKNILSVLGKIALPLLILTTIWQGIVGAWEAYQETGNIGDAFVGAIGQIVEFFSVGLIDKEMVKGFFNSIQDLIAPLVDSVGNFFGSIGKWFADKFAFVGSLFGTKLKPQTGDAGNKANEELKRKRAEEDKQQKEAAQQARDAIEAKKSAKQKSQEKRAEAQAAQAKKAEEKGAPAPVTGKGGKSAGAGATGTFEAPATAPKTAEKKETAPLKKPSSPGFSAGKKAMIDAMDKKGIKDPKQRAQILAQTAHESGGFKYTQELGNEKYFQKYEGRKDLGNVNPGDGLKFIGRGFLQTTGRTNYQQFKDKFGVDVISDPSLLAKPEYAAESALFWFDKNAGKVSKLSKGDWSNTEAITRAVNGGLNGLDDRKKYFDLFKDDPEVTGIPSNVVTSGTGTPIQTGSGGFLTTTQTDAKKEEPKGSGDDTAKYPTSGGQAKVTSMYGWRKQPAGPKQGERIFHGGIDYAGVPKGSPIQILASGKVLEATSKTGYGNMIDLLINGEVLRFAHLDSMNVKKGDDVTPKTIIGTLGNTGIGTGPHLHFEHRSKSSYQDAEVATFDPLKSGAPNLIAIGDKPVEMKESKSEGGLDSSGSKIAANSVDISAAQRQQQKPQTPIIVNAPTTNNNVVTTKKQNLIVKNNNVAGSYAAAAA